MKINGMIKKEGTKFSYVNPGECFAFMNGTNFPEQNLFIKTKNNSAVRLSDGLVYQNPMNEFEYENEEDCFIDNDTRVKIVPVELKIN